jgi:DNA-binding NarL/FixJ family response regulator
MVHGLSRHQLRAGRITYEWTSFDAFGLAKRLFYPAGVPIRVVVAEDNVLVREGLRQVLDVASSVEVVAVCSDLDSLREAVERAQPDVVLTDIRMPPTLSDEGVRIAAELRQAHPEMGVVVLSQYVEPEYALGLLEDGAAGRAYLLKERVGDPGELVSAIEQVAHQGSVIDRRVVDALVAARPRRRASVLDELTPREHEVLAQVAQGMSNAAIARKLVLSERAVEKHINGVFSKLELGGDQDTHRRVKAALLYLAEAGR